MNTLYVRCQTKDYILDIVAARAGMRINKVNSEINMLINLGKVREWGHHDRLPNYSHRYKMVNEQKIKILVHFYPCLCIFVHVTCMSMFVHQTVECRA